MLCLYNMFARVPQNQMLYKNIKLKNKTVTIWPIFLVFLLWIEFVFHIYLFDCETFSWVIPSPKPPIYPHLIFAIVQFDISSLMNFFFILFQTWTLQATAGRKIQFKLGKNPIHLTRYFRLENVKNQVLIDMGSII